MKNTISKSFLRGYWKVLSLVGTKEWPDISDDNKKDYQALRSDWINVGDTIREETRNFKRM